MNTNVPCSPPQPPVPSPNSRADQAIAACREHFLDYDWRFSKASREAIVDRIRRQPGVHRVAYLGCPTVAVVHATADPRAEDSILLIDKGHAGISSWIDDGLIDASQYLSFDLLDTNALPVLMPFDAVIADPPWYEPEYGAFVTAARQLVRPGGIVGITLFPPVSPYKNYKRSYFGHLIGRSFGIGTADASYFGRMDVSYTCPSFESSWNGERAFIDRQSRRYRPATMEVFRIHSDRTASIARTITTLSSKLLPRVIRMNDGHYLRAVAESPAFPVCVTAETDRRLSHINELSSDIVAWSTVNTVVRIAKNGDTVRNDDQIVQLVTAHEGRGAGNQ